MNHINLLFRPILKKGLMPSASLRANQSRSIQYSRFLKAEENNVNGKKAEEATKEEAKEGTSEKAAELIKEKEKQIAEIKDHYLRSLADMENLRQRTKKDMENATNFALQKFVKDLLSTVDILEMALKSVGKEQIESSKVVSDFHVGVSMTQTELLKTLKNHGVLPINPVGEPFDPNMHQALYKAPVPGKESDTILAVEKVGYTLNGRVIRPAQVGVVKN